MTTEIMPVRLACELYGGKATLRKRIFDAFIDSEVGAKEGLMKRVQLENINQGLAMAMLNRIGKNYDSTMGTPRLDEEQRRYWTARYHASGSGPVGHGHTLDGEPVLELDPRVQLDIYIMLEALEELDTP